MSMEAWIDSKMHGFGKDIEWTLFGENEHMWLKVKNFWGDSDVKSLYSLGYISTNAV